MHYRCFICPGPGQVKSGRTRRGLDDPAMRDRAFRQLDGGGRRSRHFVIEEDLPGHCAHGGLAARTFVT